MLSYVLSWLIAQAARRLRVKCVRCINYVNHVNGSYFNKQLAQLTMLNCKLPVKRISACKYFPDITILDPCSSSPLLQSPLYINQIILLIVPKSNLLIFIILVATSYQLVSSQLGSIPLNIYQLLFKSLYYKQLQV